MVYHDLLGIMHHPHHEKHVPSFCKQYLKLGSNINDALTQYRQEVVAGSFPTDVHSPYKMSETEQQKFEEMMEVDAAERRGE